MAEVRVGVGSGVMDTVDIVGYSTVDEAQAAAKGFEAKLPTAGLASAIAREPVEVEFNGERLWIPRISGYNDQPEGEYYVPAPEYFNQSLPVGDVHWAAGLSFPER